MPKRIAYKIRYYCKCGNTFKTKRPLPVCGHCGRLDRLTTKSTTDKQMAA